MADGCSSTTGGPVSAGSSQPRSASVNDTEFGDYANIHQGDQNIGQSNVHVVYNNYGTWLPPQTENNTVFSPQSDRPNRSCWTVPFGRNRDFVGRKSVLDRLLKMILPNADTDDCQRTAIEGLGGVGKTQVALEIAFRVRDKFRDCHVFWVPATNTTAFENAYREIGRELMIQGINDDKANVKVLVKTALSRTADNWLLIIDNADDVDLLCSATKDASLIDALPFSLKGSILLTTRNGEVCQKLDIRRENAVRLTEMSRSEAVDMLQKGLSAHQISSAESTGSLLDFLADLPLAIKQASAYMVKTGIGVVQYVEYCRLSDKRLIELLSKDFEDRARYKSNQNPIATTWMISFTAISRDNPLAAKCLQFMSLLAEKDIPKQLLPLSDDKLEAYEAIGILKAYAFINERTEEGTYDMHRLVRLVMQNWLSKGDEMKTCVTAVMQRLDVVFPSPDYQNRDVWARYLPHALIALEFQCQWLDKTAILRLLYRVARGIFMLGKYKEAEQMYREGLKLSIKILGAEHPETLVYMTDLAIALNNQGQYEEAEQIFQQALNLRRKVLGDEHSDTLSSMSNLAAALYGQHRFEEAGKIHLQTLDLGRKVLSNEHPGMLSSMSNLAAALYGQHRFKEAEQIFQQALNLSRKVLGNEHPDTLASINNLAVTLCGQHRFEEAEKIHLQTLDLGRKVLGNEHPDMLSSMNNLAAALYGQHRFKEAEQIFQQALDLRRKVLGNEHPNTLETMSKLARAFYHQHQFEEAKEIYQQTLEIQMEVLGAEHPKTLETMNSLASISQS